VDPLRIRRVNGAAERPGGDFVLYWMIAARRAAWNHALDHAVAAARRLGKPLVVLEALRAGYPWASARLHAFVLQGMADNARAFARHAGVVYHPYVEPEAGAGAGLVEALAARAALVVTDDYPTFFLPRMVAATAARLAVAVDAVDGNGLLPMRAASEAFPTAYAFRRFLQRTLSPHLADLPRADPLAGARLPGPADLPRGVASRWPAASAALLAADAAALARLPIDHAVRPVATRGGHAAALTRWRAFLGNGLAAYAEHRSDPDRDASSGLSPYLHFGHIGVHQLLVGLADAAGWDPSRLGATRSGKREGFWNLGPAADAFLDELVTWRELGFNFCSQRADHDRYESLPAWAQKTLAEHSRDPRPVRYDRAAFEAARTHDPLWNAAQRQLLAEGRIHNYLRMLWGKKILEWSATPREALATMIELNNRWAVDGRDPNSVSGIFWVLGRYDRPWGPVRPIFGTIRYMSSDNTARKLEVRDYLARWGAGAAGAQLRLV
jgi:deoxyribodipyrimidine photo-lyase